MSEITIQTAPFDPFAEQDALRAGNASVGAIVAFVGLMRDINEGDEVRAMRLEHYPGMTEKAIAEIVAEARALSRAAEYAEWRARPEGRVPDLEGIEQCLVFGRYLAAQSGLELAQFADLAGRAPAAGCTSEVFPRPAGRPADQREPRRGRCGRPADRDGRGNRHSP